jgi:hypothetical protein
MRRRSLLRAGAASLALPVVGGAAARPSTDAQYQPIGSLGFDDAREVVVDDAGEVAYVAAATHVTAVDLTDPANPTKLSEVEIGADHSDGPLSGVQDAKVDGDRLVAAGPPSPGRGLWGFGLVDVSDPANMTEVSFVETSPAHANHNCAIDGDHVYLTGTNGSTGGDEAVRIYDVADDDPEEVATWYPGDHDAAWDDVLVFLRNLHDVFVQDGVAYLAYWDSGVFMIDVSDPATPEYINRVGDYTLEELQDVGRGELQQEFIEPPGNAHYVTVNEDATILGEGGESWDARQGDDAGGPSPITLYDVSDPESPEELATVETEATGDNTRSGWYSTSHNFEIHGGKLYSSWYNAGVKIHDISDPANPEQIAWYADPDSKAFWTAQVGVPDDFFVATTYRSVPRGSDTALYTFPDEAGQMESAPSFPALDESDGGATTTATATAGGSGTTTATDGTETEAMDGDGGDDESTTEAEDGDGDGGGSPGLGVVSALAGLGVGAWRLRERRADE